MKTHEYASGSVERAVAKKISRDVVVRDLRAKNHLSHQLLLKCRKTALEAAHRILDVSDELIRLRNLLKAVQKPPSEVVNALLELEVITEMTAKPVESLMQTVDVVGDHVGLVHGGKR